MNAQPNAVRHDIVVVPTAFCCANLWLGFYNDVVLTLDWGEPLEHVTGYETAMKAPWEMAHGNKLTNDSR